ncbi:MAG TPA: GNAT family N-acetyltransferase [Ideonella sp.]|uniref:GNAT family N-acetyltransferase n=1 Tax=Ideonella sp. TaxID=1929293 RepID=UPI002D1B1C75|nr:GNAT family N-acetyltransferase [Ideonella sp.]HSI49615.1 GNAT family N-acetyltransferase [Ideonella sp.]
MQVTEPIEILRTRRLRLRQFTRADAGLVLALLNSPGWLRYIGDRGVRDEAQARDWMACRLLNHYAETGHGFWAVERLDDGAPVGLCGLIHREGLPEPDLGYALLPEQEGQGFAREAAAACLVHGHQLLKMPRILAITSPENLASARVLVDIGMREVGNVRLPTDPPDAPPLRMFESLG